MSNDSQKVFDLLPQIHLLWSAPMQILISSYLLYLALGVRWSSQMIFFSTFQGKYIHIYDSAFAGVFVLISLVPINMFIAKLYGAVRNKHLPILDERVKLCSESLQSIRAIKFYNW